MDRHRLDAAVALLSTVERGVMTTSFGLEDQVVSALVVRAGTDMDFVTLDTGRLFPQTYDIWAETEARLGIRVVAMTPDADALAALVDARGINGFYASVDARKACCAVRKVEPLGRALDGYASWVTGLRAGQDPGRAGVTERRWDDDRRLWVYAPLAGWDRDEVLEAAAMLNVPIHPLHARGYASIGCAPCTRAIRDGEPERAGRWWWEEGTAKECGLHVAPDGSLVRAR